MKSILKYFLITIGILLTIVIIWAILLQSGKFQTFITKKITQAISNNLNTEIDFERINIKFFNKVEIDDIYIEDLTGDTMIYVGKLTANISALSIIKRSIYLSQLNLQNPKVNFIKRDTSSKFNFQRIRFGGSENSDTTKKKGSSFKIDLDKLIIDHSRFKMIDMAKKTELLVKIPHSIFNLNDLGLDKDKIDIESAKITNPFVSMIALEGGISDTSKKSGSVHILKGDLQIWYDKISIEDGEFVLRNEKKEIRKKGLEFNNLHVQNIDFLASDGSIVKDTIKAQIDTLRAFDKSGFTLENLTADVVVSTSGIELDDLILETPNSVIKERLAFDFKSFGDFKNFISGVRMEADFQNSVVAIQDINYFAKMLDKFDHNIVKINGQVYGTVDNLKGRDLRAEIGDLDFEGRLSIDGLPDFNESYISLRIDGLTTRVSDVEQIFPGISLPNFLSNLGLIRFKGNFDGFPNDFVTEGYLASDLGSAQSDINLKLGEKDENATYSGSLRLDHFEIGELIGQENIGSVTLSTEVTGKGLTLESLDATMDGHIKVLEFNNYAYRDIEVDGRFKFRQFQGLAKIHDDNIDLSFDGMVDLQSDVPTYQFTSVIDSVNLKNLNFTDKEIIVSTKLNLDMQGGSIGDLSGTANINDLNVETEEEIYTIDKISLSSSSTSGRRQIILDSEVLRASISGQFDLEKIPQAFQWYANEFYPLPGSDTNYTLPANQDLEFEVHIKNSKNISQIFIENYFNINSADLKGHLTTNAPSFSLNSTIGSISYKKNKFKNISIQANGGEKNLIISTQVKTIANDNGILAQNAVVEGDFDNRLLEWDISVMGDTVANRLDVSGTFDNRSEKKILTISPSEVYLNNTLWKFSENNKLVISPESIEVSNFYIYHGNQKLSVSSVNTEGSSTLKFSLVDIALDDFLNAFTNTVENIEGVANGEVVIDDIYDNVKISANINVRNIAINEIKTGDLEVETRVDQENNKILIDASLNGPNNSVTISGSYSTSKEDKSLNFKLNAESLNIEPLGPFIDQYVVNPEGILKGDLTLSGTLDAPILEGLLKLIDTEVTIPFLFTRYSINEQIVQFKKGEINFDNINLQDATNNRAVASGSIYHQNLQNFNIDVAIRTEKFQFMNTNKKENETFYGSAFASGTVRISGPFKDIEIYVNATTLDNTVLHLPIGDEKDVGEYTFFTFVSAIEEEVEEDFKRNLNNLKVTLDLNITPKAQVQIIFDENAGEILKANASGSIKIIHEKLGDLEIFGEVTVESGSYVFTLQNLVNKRFIIEKGGTISWTGNPYEAQLDVTAIYTFRTSPYNLIEEYLVNASSDETTSARKRVTAKLELTLRGSLSEPNIKFDIELENPDPSIAHLVNSKLQLLQNNQTEMNKQVLGILAMNQFFPSYGGDYANPGDPSALSSGINNTVSDFLSNQISYYLSDWVSTFVPGLELDIDYNRYEYDLEETEEIIQNQRRSELYLALTKRFLDDRISITAGGNIDFGASDLERSTGLVGNIEVQYSLTQDGRWGLRAFSQSEYDVLDQGNLTTAGIGISYSEEFDTLNDLFNQLKKRKESKKDEKAKRKEEKARKEED